MDRAIQFNSTQVRRGSGDLKYLHLNTIGKKIQLCTARPDTGNVGHFNPWKSMPLQTTQKANKIFLRSILNSSGLSAF